MAKMQHVGNNEERFVLASLKEFVKTWGTGGEGCFQLDCKDGQCKMSMELNLGPQEVLFLPWLKTTRTPQMVTSGVRILLHHAVTKSTMNKTVYRGQVYDLKLPAKLSMLSRNTSKKINTLVSPITCQILALVP